MPPFMTQRFYKYIVGKECKEQVQRMFRNCYDLHKREDY
jgi:hypothetical protein